MSIRSTDTTIANSDLSTVYPTDHFGNEEIPSGNVFVGARDVPFAVLTAPVTNGNVVNALWSLPADLGNELLDDPPEGVPDNVFLDLWLFCYGLYASNCRVLHSKCRIRFDTTMFVAH
jgi:hypothetical protein